MSNYKPGDVVLFRTPKKGGWGRLDFDEKVLKATLLERIEKKDAWFIRCPDIPRSMENDFFTIFESRIIMLLDGRDANKERSDE